MDAIADLAMLNEQVGCLRLRLRTPSAETVDVTPSAATPAAEATEVGLMVELAHTLGLRSDCRKAAGDTEGAVEDLNEVIEWARAALRLAAGERDEGVDPGERVDPETIADAQQLLVYALGYRFYLVADSLDQEDASVVALLRADRDEAIAAMAALLRCLPPDYPIWPEAALTAGRLRYDRYTDPWPGAEPPDPDDLDAACDLLTQSAAGDEDETGELTAFYLVLALRDRLDLLGNDADRDAFITWGERMLGFPDEAGTDWLDLRDRLGTELFGRAESAADTGPGAVARLADLDAAIGHLEAVLAAAEPGEPGRVYLLGMLAHACWLRVGDHTQHAEIDRMTSYARQAWAASRERGASGEGGAPEEEAASREELSPRDREMIGVYLCIGLYERLRRPGVPYEPDSVDLMISVLTEVEPLLADDADLHLWVEVMLGFCLATRGQVTGSAADFAAAQPWLSHAIGEVSAGDPERSDLTQILGVGLCVLAGVGAMAGHLDQAIEFLGAAAGRPDEDPDRAAMTRAGLGFLLIQRGGQDQGSRDVGDGIAHLVAAHDLALPGSAVRMMISWNLGSALLTRFGLRGDRQDLDAARFYLDVPRDQAPASWAAVSDLVPDFDLISTANQGVLCAVKGMDGDVQAIDQGIDSFRAAIAMAPAGHPQRARLRSDLGLALIQRYVHGGMSTADIREAVRELDAGVACIPAGHPMRTLAMFRAGGALGILGIAAQDPPLLRRAIGHLSRVLTELDPIFGERVRVVGLLGMVTAELHRLTGDPADRDDAVARMTEACRELDGRPGHPQHATVLTRLARLHRACGETGPAREQGLAALRVRVRDVLLQTGTARALTSARAVTAVAAEVAEWCLGDHEPGQAVEALELGRGLVLHAATGAADLPELLSAAGRDDLAWEWRQAAASGAGPATESDPPWDDDAGGAEYVTRLLADGSLVAPSDLRRRALGALTSSAAAGELLTPPGPADIAAALTRTDADALVYLLPPSDGQSGRAVLVAADHVTAAPRVAGISLPLLRPGLSGAFDDYLTSHADVLAFPYRPASDSQDAHQERTQAQVVERWESALGLLAEWAWPAVVKPVLDQVASWQLDRLPRLVLIPIGPLSLVPWHAARSRCGGQDSWYYACAAAVISYAASARQLLEVSRRPSAPANGTPARAPRTGPVIVADPTASLVYAIWEAQAIRDCCYPDARYLGPADQRGLSDGEGRPDEVLDALPAPGHAGASVVHIGCHANVVGSAPGQSHLLLAGYEQLRVDAILKHARGRSPGMPGGLVSLAACRTDLAAEDYDEALTLATAFLAAGAVTVVGARWEIPDRASALLMFMYHYLMVRGGHPPRDALRLAQLWMIDPQRVAPAEMPPLLAEKARLVRLANLTAWAGFTHQGR
jgi:hypothetical protein